MVAQVLLGLRHFCWRARKGSGSHRELGVPQRLKAAIRDRLGRHGSKPCPSRSRSKAKSKAAGRGARSTRSKSKAKSKTTE